MSKPQASVVFLDAATYGDMPLTAFTETWDCTVHQVTKPGQTAERLAGHGIAVTNKIVIDEAVLNLPALRELKLIAVAATGTDIIDKQAAAKKGVKVCNVPGYASQSVAQFTMALILELASRASSYAAAVKAGEWQKSPVFTLLNFPNIELSGKKLGIIGFGNIGRTVAQMARGFGMEILIGARPGEPTPGADRVPLAELFRQADFISLHCPLTAETRNLINQPVFGVNEAERVPDQHRPRRPDRRAGADSSAAHQAYRRRRPRCDHARAAIRRSPDHPRRVRVGQSNRHAPHRLVGARSAPAAIGGSQNQH